MVSRQVKVGVFVLAGLIVAGILVFMVGEERHLFQRKAHLYTSFRDVAGLKNGSPVRMGGVDIGQVDAIEFGRDVGDRQIHVRVSIVAEQLRWIRQDSVARIVSKGLLGDKALELTMGSTARPPVGDEGVVRGEESDDIGAAIRNAGEALGRANQVLTNVAEATRPLASPALGNDVVALVHDLRVLTRQVTEGPGTVHRLLTDEAAAQRVESTLAATERAANRMASSMDDVAALAREARSGRGMIHALVYDPAGETLVRSMARAADELGAITHDVRTGNGGLHRIIYGTESAQAVANVNEATAELRDILRDVHAGRGTVGALLVDPSLYEDLKSLVGNIQRNEILRAMVRYSIHQDETRRPAPAATPAATPPSR